MNLNPVTYLDANPKEQAGFLVALWVVVVLLILHVLGYSWKNLMPKESLVGGSEPLRSLYGNSASSQETAVLSQPGQGFNERAGFTGGFKTHGPAFHESQALNDNVYTDGLDARSATRYFTANPEWAAFEDKVLKSFDSVQTLTRYHNTSTGEKIAILKLGATRLGLPLPTSQPPVAEGMLGQRNKVSGMSDGKLVPNY